MCAFFYVYLTNKNCNKKLSNVIMTLMVMLIKQELNFCITVYMHYSIHYCIYALQYTA